MMTFAVHDAYHRPVGRCMSKLISNINHACVPNAFIACPEGFDVPDPLRVIATDRVRDQKEVRRVRDLLKTDHYQLH